VKAPRNYNRNLGLRFASIILKINKQTKTNKKTPVGCFVGWIKIQIVLGQELKERSRQTNHFAPSV